MQLCCIYSVERLWVDISRSGTVFDIGRNYRQRWFEYCEWHIVIKNEYCLSSEPTNWQRLWCCQEREWRFRDWIDLVLVEMHVHDCTKPGSVLNGLRRSLFQSVRQMRSSGFLYHAATPHDEVASNDMISFKVTVDESWDRNIESGQTGIFIIEPSLDNNYS